MASKNIHSTFLVIPVLSLICNMAKLKRPKISERKTQKRCRFEYSTSCTASFICTVALIISAFLWTRVRTSHRPQCMQEDEYVHSCRSRGISCPWIGRCCCRFTHEPTGHLTHAFTHTYNHFHFYLVLFDLAFR